VPPDPDPPAPVGARPADEGRRIEPFQAPRGTHDVLPPESARWEDLIATFAGVARRAGYGFVQGPMFEDLGVFKRMGEGTDVVRKEMYDFLDKSEPPHHLALRPEGTASVARAYVEHHPTPPWKVWYAAPSFRYENTQANRYRQHHQLGIEAIGPADPDLDVEVIGLLWDFYAELGLRQVELVINSIGTPADRTAYMDQLRSYLVGRIRELAPDDQEKVEAHPMRVLDTKREQSLPVVADAPLLIDSLSPEAKEHFERVQRGLAALEIPFRIEPRLVRGLDYYTHTAFEMQSAALGGAQNTIGGGGRYDGLVESLGGDPTPGIGFGTGIERILATCDAEGVFPVPERHVDVYVTDLTGGEEARDLTFLLRRAGIGADRAFAAAAFQTRSMKSQMKSAGRSGAAFAVIVGEDEVAAGTVTVRDLRGQAGDERPRQETVARNQLVDHLRARLSD
jgi:histidyl-tRNA synthetase